MMLSSYWSSKEKLQSRRQIAAPISGPIRCQVRFRTVKCSRTQKHVKPGKSNLWKMNAFSFIYELNWVEYECRIIAVLGIL